LVGEAQKWLLELPRELYQMASLCAKLNVAGDRTVEEKKYFYTGYR
jgi:hypothetical protein